MEITDQDRARRRVRRASATAAASTLAAGVNLAVTLLVVPLSLTYLGNERYGLWMTVATLTTMVAFADFGMGNGLLNAIAHADGRDDDRAAAAAVSSAVFMLGGLALLLAGLFWITFPYVAWERVVNASGPSLAREARMAVAITLTCAAASLPLGTTQRIQMGYQEGFVNGGWQAGGTMLGLVALVIAIGHRASLPVLVLCLAGAPVVALAANGVALYGFRRPRLRPSWHAVSRHTMRELLRAGVLFFAIQLATAVGAQLPTLAIARLLDPAAVTTFVVPFRLSLVMPSILGYFLTPLWPAYREALTRDDVVWVRHLVRKSVTLAAVLSLAWAVTLVLAGPAILKWWVGGRVTATLTLRVALGLWSLFAGLAGPLAMFLNGAGALRFQAVCGWLMATASITGCVVLVPRLGVAGAAWAMVIAQACCLLLPTILYVPRVLARIERVRAAA